MGNLSDHISDEDRRQLEMVAEQAKKPDRLRTLAEMKLRMTQSGARPDDGQLRLRTTRDAAELLMWEIVKRVGEQAQWPEDYDQVAAWLTDNRGKGLMLIGDCGRGKSMITTEILPDLFRLGYIVDADSGMKMAEPYICTARELRKCYKEALSHRIIIIDDVGTEGIENSFGEKMDWFSELVLDIDRPYRDSKGRTVRRLLICSTNLNKWQLFGGDRRDYPEDGKTTHYDGRYPDMRVQDRLKAMTKRIFLYGESFRH